MKTKKITTPAHSMKTNNHRALLRSYQNASTGHRIPDWVKRKNELEMMERKINGPPPQKDPAVVWKASDQSFTDIDREIMAKRQAAEVKEAYLGDEELRQAEERAERAEKRAQEQEQQLTDAYRRTGIIPF